MITPTKKSPIYSVSMPEDVYEKIKAHAMERNIPFSLFLREAALEKIEQAGVTINSMSDFITKRFDCLESKVDNVTDRVGNLEGRLDYLQRILV